MWFNFWATLTSQRWQELFDNDKRMIIQFQSSPPLNLSPLLYSKLDSHECNTRSEKEYPFPYYIGYKRPGQTFRLIQKSQAEFHAAWQWFPAGLPKPQHFL